MWDELNQITARKLPVEIPLKNSLKATVKIAHWRLAMVTYKTSLKVSELPWADVGPQILYISVHVSGDAGSDGLTRDERTSALQELLNFLSVCVCGKGRKRKAPLSLQQQELFLVLTAGFRALFVVLGWAAAEVVSVNKTLYSIILTRTEETVSDRFKRKV